ncbi:MAG: 50S ribosomal protein L9 [Spirochaetaceae bacterium]|jgi:large subunit ribosomal protein L9|nr:50S ribosomal protein L9 [Spirochaetaceae bacterium]
MNVKVILNKDVSPLGEEGDVKEVARGYARNYLLPRGLALPYTSRIVKLFEGRQTEINARKEQKRQDALGLKEKLEQLQLAVVMPAGANGKLYGAVTNQTIADELAKQGIVIERKRIEIPGNSVKSVGKYKFIVKLYGNASADMVLIVQAAEVKTSGHETHAEARRHKHEKSAAVSETAAAEEAQDSTAETAPQQIKPAEESVTPAG